MKQIVIIVLVLLAAETGYAQTVEKRVENKTKQRANTRVDQGIDRGLDKVEEGIGGLFKKKKKKEKKEDAGDNENATGNNKGNTNNTGGKSNGTGGDTAHKVNSASDFVPGATLIFADKYEKDALNDFPAQWNSTGSGKVVTINGVPGKWLELELSTVVNPVLNKPLPENCTIEFDLFLASQPGRPTPYIQFGITSAKDIIREKVYYKSKFYVSVDNYDQQNGRLIEYGIDLSQSLGTKNDFPLNKYVNKVLHVSMAINKTRIRVYFDQQKLIDLPRVLTPEMRNNFYVSHQYTTAAAEQGVLISNLRIAAAETDARSLLIKQLMEEGKAVTNDILFDVNSDVIKKESYSIVNQFGEALKTNPGLRIKITGHTDSDGAAAANLELSKKRAAAVKTYLLIKYEIDDARIQTDGKGATQPVMPNATTAGKAKNRRVEFVKL
jgi:OmpA-OmpF porin, OOP family